MIKLNKLSQPEVLQKNWQKWTERLLQKTQNGTATDADKTKYRHKDIKAVLRKETQDKCAYCEAKITHIAYGDVEHIWPKSDKIEMSFVWFNLTLACDLCNTNKGSYADQNFRLIDPYIDDPNDHFVWDGPMVSPRPQSTLGWLSERKLDLNRIELVEDRIRRIKSLNTLFKNAYLVSDVDEKNALLQDIYENETRPSVEYAALSRSYIEIARSRLEADS